MSARLLKKVLKEQEQLQQQQEHEEEKQLNGDESGSPGSSSRPSKNPFDLLNEEEDDNHDPQSDQGNVTEIADETMIGKKDKQALPRLKSTSNVFSTSNHKVKKNKKKRSKEVGSSNADEPLDVTLDSLLLNNNSSIPKSALEKAKSGNAKVCQNDVKQTAPSVLQVDPKYLNVENELRRIFGSKVVRSFEKSNQSGTSRQIRGGRRMSYHVRKTVLVTPSEHWPRWDGSFFMDFLETKDGCHYFRYAHSSSYSQAQSSFQAAQAIHDLNGVASIQLHHPYHLDSLITMADYFRFVGEHQLSADAIGKCLYGLECAWHPMFTPFQGNCRLKFHHETNKPLFATLFSHMKNMDRRGCHRSALEVCKLLLSLDSDDPMGALFCIDYFALRAGEYAFLEQFSEEYKGDNSLWLFPNFSYSLAVCRFYLEREESSPDTDMDTTKASSTDLMKQALMLYPSVLKKLVAKVPLKDQAWTRMLKHSFFRSDQTRVPPVDHLISIYVERSYLIWRLPDLQKLLRNAAELVIETLEHNESDAKDWACVRKEAFPSEKNEYSHLSVQDFSDSVPTLPPDNLQNFVMDLRMREGAHNGDQVVNPVNGGHAPATREAANRNPLAVLFESILPWVNYGDAADGAGLDEHNQLDGHGPVNEEH